MRSETARRGGISLRVAVTGKTLVYFWGLFVALNSLRVGLLGYPDFIGALERRLVVGLVGAGLSWIIYRLLGRVKPATLEAGILWATVMSLPAAFVFSVVNFLAFNLLTPLAGDTCNHGQRCTVHDLAIGVTEMESSWTFVFLAWGLLCLSLAWAAKARDADRRAATDREAAQNAQIAALRYQVNPHFLFNMLNSLMALVSREETREAEQMIAEIASFFRYSLATDPVADTLLVDEIDLQRRYLELERRRFPTRLKFAIDIDPRLINALVPPLILQPLLENAVKHGVGRTITPVTVSIQAKSGTDGSLVVIVEDDSRTMADDGSSIRRPDGLGLGLRNVAERLSARFGTRASLVAGPRLQGGFRAEITVPLIKGLS